MDPSGEKTMKPEDLRPCSKMERVEIASQAQTSGSEKKRSGQHSHTVYVKLGQTSKQSTTCTEPQTILEVINSNAVLQQKLPSEDGKIIIQLGNDKAEEGTIIPTHFPCTCIDDGVSLFVSSCGKGAEVVENPLQNQPDEDDRPDEDDEIPNKIQILPKDNYILFYVDTVGGDNTKSRNLFQSNSFKHYKCLCVYGEKGMTVEEVLERDGRFSNDILADDYYLSIGRQLKTHKTQPIDNLADKTFHISAERKKTSRSAQRKSNDSLDGEKSQRNANLHESPPNSAQCKVRERLPAGIPVQQCGISVKTAMERGDFDTTEIYNILREQFPNLIKWMENRFPADSYQKILEQKKENFGNIQQSFNEAYRKRMLLKQGDSVCHLSVGTSCQGTGFVLFDQFILTNAHLFDKLVIKDKNVVSNINILAHFNYENPVSNEKVYCFTAKNKLVDFEKSLDYAVLELNAEEHVDAPVPPGLLKDFGQLPDDGEVCVIGHPGGNVKKLDPTFVLPQESTDTNMHQNPLLLCSIEQYFKKQGTEAIMIRKSDINYKTGFMFHGSSGSPVFDGSGSAVGLHSSGTFLTDEKKLAIACAHPLLIIFESFVWNLKKTRNDELLKKVIQVAERNALLKDKLDYVLKPWPNVVRPMGLMGSEPADAQEPGIARVEQAAAVEPGISGAAAAVEPGISEAEQMDNEEFESEQTDDEESGSSESEQIDDEESVLSESRQTDDEEPMDTV